MTERWPRVMKIVMLVSLMWLSTWAGMAWARGETEWYVILELVASMVAATLYVSGPAYTGSDPQP